MQNLWFLSIVSTSAGKYDQNIFKIIPVSQYMALFIFLMHDWVLTTFSTDWEEKQQYIDLECISNFTRGQIIQWALLAGAHVHLGPKRGEEIFVCVFMLSANSALIGKRYLQ